MASVLVRSSGSMEIEITVSHFRSSDIKNETILQCGCHYNSNLQYNYVFTPAPLVPPARFLSSSKGR